MSLKRLLNKLPGAAKLLRKILTGPSPTSDWKQFLFDMAKFWFGNRCPQTDEDISKEMSESVQAARRESHDGGI